MYKNSAILSAAKEKIADPARWIKGMFAKTADGQGTSGLDQNAVCFCSVGALQAVIGFCPTARYPSAQLLCEVIGGTFEDVPSWNDDPSTTHKDVMATFDKAIALAKSRGD